MVLQSVKGHEPPYFVTRSKFPQELPFFQGLASETPCSKSKCKSFESFSRVQLELPNIRTFMPWEYCVDHPFFFKKFVVSASNLERHSDYTVMVICGSERRLAYFKPGQETWITVDTGNWYRFHDVIYHKGRFLL